MQKINPLQEGVEIVLKARATLVIRVALASPMSACTPELLTTFGINQLLSSIRLQELSSE